MIIPDDNKRTGALILEKFNTDGSKDEDEMGPNESKLAIAEDLLDAISSNSKEGIVAAFEAMFAEIENDSMRDSE